MATRPDAGSLVVFVGTFTEPSRNGRGEGIYVFRMDRSSGALTRAHVVPNVANPSFLALDPQQRHLYCNNAIADYNGTASGAVSAFAVDAATGGLAFLNSQPSGGVSPAHVCVDPTGRYVLAANYGSGSVAVLPRGTDGRLGPPSDVVQHAGPPGPVVGRQEDPHAHQITVDLAGRYVLANDLGLDRTYVYRLDLVAGKLIPNDPPFAPASPGGGPRHLAYHPSERFIYVLNEIASTVTAFAYDAARGALAPIQTISTLPEGFAGRNSTAQIVVDATGRFVYASNRGHDSIAQFAVDGATGRLTFVAHTSTQGQMPRNFAIDPSGTLLLAANQESDTIVTFRIDPSTGRLAPAGAVAEAGSPVCILFHGA